MSVRINGAINILIYFFRFFPTHIIALRYKFVNGYNPLFLIRDSFTSEFSTPILILTILISLFLQILRVALSSSLECITCNAMQDMCFVGSTNGSIYVIDLTITAIAMSAVNSAVGYVTNKQGGES